MLKRTDSPASGSSEAPGSADLSIAFVRRAVVSAAVFEEGYRFSGGVYSRDGLVPQSRRESANVQYVPSDADRFLAPAPRRRLQGTYVYAGWLHDHFGHFLLESLSRLWLLDSLQANIKLIYHPWRGASIARVFARDYVRAIFSALGIDMSRVIVVSNACIVDELLVPAPAFRINNGAHSEMNSVFDKIAERMLSAQRTGPDTERLYLSRALLPTPARRPTNEAAVEQTFARHGFRILHPELVTFQDQVRLVRRARMLAGPDGSGLHLVAFMTPGPTVITLQGRDSGGTNQLALNQLRSAKSVSVAPKSVEDGGGFVVDVDAVEELLTSFGSKPGGT